MHRLDCEGYSWCRTRGLVQHTQTNTHRTQIHTHANICQTNEHVSSCWGMYLCILVWLHAHTHTHTYMYIYINIYTCIYIYTYTTYSVYNVCVYVCACAYEESYAYVHTHTLTHLAKVIHASKCDSQQPASNKGYFPVAIGTALHRRCDPSMSFSNGCVV
jgi:hypothetical protein